MRWLLILAVVLAGCEIPQDPVNFRSKSVSYGSGVEILTIDECEYILVDRGMSESARLCLIHKANCKNPIHQHLAEEKVP